MTPEEACRIQIKLRLEQTDEIVQIPDHSELTAIKAYRQKLRDYPATTDFPDITKLPDHWK